MSDKFLSTFMDTFELSVGPSLGPQAMARSSHGLGQTAAANAHLGLGASSSNPHLWQSPVPSPAPLSRHNDHRPHGQSRPSASAANVAQHGASSSSSLPLSTVGGAPNSDLDTTHTSSRQSLLDSETSASLIDEQVYLVSDVVVFGVSSQLPRKNRLNVTMRGGGERER